VYVAVEVAVKVGVAVTVAVAVMVGVGVGVAVAVAVAVMVGVGVGVAGIRLNAEATSPADPPTRFHIATMLLPVPEVTGREMLFAVASELTDVGGYQEVYGQFASVCFTSPSSMYHDTRAEDPS
jgi:anti-sigma factor RsiW